jgi:hypothetical protein
MIGGGARFLGSSVSNQLTANVEISASAAYLFQLDRNEAKKNKGTIALGLQPSFAWDPLSDVYKVTVFSRYYYNFERVSPFIEADLGYRLQNNFSPSSGELTAYVESFVPGVKLGGAFYISPHVTFDAYLFYDNFNSTNHILEPSEVTNKSVEHAFGLGLGFQIFLQCKK